MREPVSVQERFKGRHFDREIIILRVRRCLSFKLSSRDLVQVVAARGLVLAHNCLSSKRGAIAAAKRPFLRQSSYRPRFLACTLPSLKLSDRYDAGYKTEWFALR